MTNENTVEVAVEEVAKPKRVRKVAPKVQKTGAEIIAEIATLEEAVTDLDTAIRTLDPTNIIFQLAEKELNGKRKELEDARDTLYTFI